VRSLVGTRWEVSPEGSSVGGERADEPVGAAHSTVGPEFQRDLAVVREIDFREIAIVLIKLMRPRNVAAKDNPTRNFKVV